MSAARRTQSHARALLSLAALAAVVAYLVQSWSEVLVPAALSRATVLESNLTSVLQTQRLTTTAQQCAPAALDSVNEVRGSSVEEASSETRLTPVCAQELLHPLLSELVKTPFFRYFRVNLYGRCHFWCVCQTPAWKTEAP
jgi:Endoplasmic Reticulum Oxidoreductin 1 (ERO1)